MLKNILRVKRWPQRIMRKDQSLLPENKTSETILSVDNAVIATSSLLTDKKI